MAIIQNPKLSDLLLLVGFLALPLSLGELVTPAMADFLDHCPKDCHCKWAQGKREADCTRTGFTAVPTHLDHEIQILRMTDNYIRVLGDEVFKSAGLLNLQRIFMDNCHMEQIHSSAFKDLRILVELNLSHNNLTHIEQDTFSGNERLQTLTLSNNRIATLSPYVFPLLKHLKSIDLSHNLIDEVQRNTFENLGNSVESLNLDNNRIGSLKEEVFLPLTNLKSLQLHSNPWNCDCHLKNFRDWVVFRGLYTYPTSCAEPERLADKLWQDVDPKDFACKPEIRIPQDVVFSQPGANVTLSCFIIGNPMPDAKWVLKGRIVNNNTIPAGGIPPQSRPPSSEGETTTTSTTTPWTPTTSWSSTNNQRGGGHEVTPIPGPTQYLIHEEGGLERWFNLTITNVGLESVADYTCVAVNAGGVMEEAITLTFEEPEPVGLPGGKKERKDTNLAIIIGAAAGGVLFGFVLLLIFCCCCCRRRSKMGHNGSASASGSNSSSQGGTTSLERHGSIVGYGDSSQRLLQNNSSDYGIRKSNVYETELKNSSSKSSRLYSEASSSDYHGLPPPPPPLQEMEIHPNNSKVDLPNSPISHYELQPMLRSPRQQPKTLMVTSSGDTFHTLADPDTYPDLLNLHPVKSSPQHSQNQQHQQTTSGSSTSVTSGGQVLNPATLVIPPAPPAQFPHQFQHLIHHKPVNRAHSPPNQHILVSPLLSPPAQFSSGSPKPDPKGYVTLPRKLTRGPIDWSTMTERPPIYDGVGPRTSALGNSDMVVVKPSMSSEAVVSMTTSASNSNRTITPSSSGITTSQQKRTSSLKRFPENTTNTNSTTARDRDSSASEVTLTGDTDSLTAYIEPFGRATLPLMSCRPDSIASATDSDLEAILSREDTGPTGICHDNVTTKRGAIAVAAASSNHRSSSKSNITNSVTSGGSQLSCPLHTKSNVMLGPKIIAIPRDTSKHVVQLTKGPKQLKGILKMPAKNNITTNPVESLGLPPIPPPPPLSSSTAAAAMSQQAKNCRETSATSSSGSSGGSPPALEKATTNDLINDLSGVHISLSSKPKPPLRTSSSMNSKNGVSEALHV